MQKIIWKYELETTDIQKLELPKGAEILTVQVQKGIPCLWALVDPSIEIPKERRVIAIFGTGNFINSIAHFSGMKYIATYQLLAGNFIGHVFELINKL